MCRTARQDARATPQRNRLQKDFRKLPQGVGALSPDDFLCDRFDAAPEVMAEIVSAQAAALKRPPVTFTDLLVGLEKTVPMFVRALRRHAEEE